MHCNQCSIGSVEVRFFIGDPKNSLLNSIRITSGAKILNFISAIVTATVVC